MATYGSGTRVSAAISNSATASNSGGNTYATLYTCPANSYAVVWVRADFVRNVSGFNYGSAHYIYAGGQHIAVVSTSGTAGFSGIVASGSTSTNAANQSNSANSVFQIYVGPGQTVQVRTDNNTGYGASASTTGYIQGTEFTNG